jgi:hypothetical protein
MFRRQWHGRRGRREDPSRELRGRFIGEQFCQAAVDESVLVFVGRRGVRVFVRGVHDGNING